MPRVIIYRSSAGSGKTFTLVFNYLKILLGDAGKFQPQIFRQILAITFTNKAANEMKSRLIEVLTDFSGGNIHSDMFQKLKAELKIEDEVLCKRASDALDNILQNYGHLHIQTIDSFFQGIVRSFSKELKLPYHYKVEMQESFVLEAIVANLFQTSIENKRLYKYISDYALEEMSEGKSWNFEKSMLDFSKNLFKPEAGNYTYSDEEIKAIIEKLRKIREGYFKKVSLAAEAILSKMPDTINQMDFSHNGAFYKKLIECKLIDYKSDLWNNIIADKSLITFIKILDGSGKPYVKNHFKSFEMDDFLDDTFTERTHLLELITGQEVQAANTADIILQNISKTALLSYLSRELASFRSEHETILISDLTNFINKMIEDEDTPFIYEKRGAQIQYLLFDEFQDTSLQQWQNIFPLAEHILSQAKSNETKVMLVGDAKQSIYRWRKGEIDLILRSAPEALKPYGLNIESLSENYRSLTSIVNFNNALFENFKNTHGGVYDEIHHLLKDVKQSVGKNSEQKGYIEINILQATEEDKFVDMALERTLQTILELTDRSNYQLSDICLLTRSNKEGNLLANYLADKGISCSSPDSVFLDDGLIVRFFLAAFRYIDNPKDEIAYTEIAYLLYQMGKLDCKEVEEVYASYKNRLLQQHYLEFFQNLKLYKSEEVSRLIFRLTKLFCLEDKADIFWIQLLSSVQNFELTQPSNLTNFFDWWEKSKTEIKVAASEENAVHLMTIHKSKGLQFPVVIMPFVDWQHIPKSDVQWLQIEGVNPMELKGNFPVVFSKKLLKSYFSESYTEEETLTLIDNVNILYVAFTRPVEQLYLFMPHKIKSDRIGSILLPQLQSLDGLTDLVKEENQIKIGKKENRVTSQKSDKAKLTGSTMFSTFKLADKAGDLTVTTRKQEMYNRAMERGIIIHEILQKVDFSQSDWKEKLSKTHKYKDWMREISDILETYSQNPVVKEWNKTGSKHFVERDIFYNGQFIRPDKFIEYPDTQSAVVVDYKTGEKRPEHTRQLQSYIEACKVTGAKEVKGYLVYVDPLELVDVK